MGNVMQFNKRARRKRELLWTRRIWTARNGRYRVSEFRYHNKSRLMFYAEFLDGECWDIISRHRKRATAETSCAKHFRRAPLRALR